MRIGRLGRVFLTTFGFVLIGCASVPPPNPDGRWFRSGTHVEFKNLSPSDAGRDFWAWDGKPSGQRFRHVGVRLTKRSGAEDYGYGIVWSFRENGNYLRLLVTTQGQFSVHEMRDGHEVTVVPWQPSPQLRQGNGAENLVFLDEVEAGVRVQFNEGPGLVLPGHRLEGKLGCFCAVSSEEAVPGQVWVEFDFDEYEIDLPDLAPVVQRNT